MTVRSGSAFSVLVVCTANHCRSPVIEHLLRETTRLAGAPWVVGSAGTRVDTVMPAHRLMVAELAQRGITIDPGWRSRQLDADLVAAADLIITADDQHRAAIATLDLTARQRTFPLLQLAEIRGSVAPADRVPVTDPSGLLQQVQALRHQVPPQATIDLADPIGRPARYFRRCARAIDDAVELITGARVGTAGRGRR